MVFNNLISGKELLLSGERFDVRSKFYDDYLTKVPNSNVFDIKMAISKAKTAITELSELTFEDRLDILKKASRKIFANSNDLEYAVKMIGMPISSVEEKITDIKKIITTVPEFVAKRFQITHGKIGSLVFNDPNMLEILEPLDGFVYIVTPGNDIRIVPFVIFWLVTLGMAGIIKVSKNDLLISQKITKTVIDSGYPASAVNILCWDTSDERRDRLNFDIIDASKVIWAYGDDNTVDNLLRFEHVQNNGFTYKIDHFSDKVVIRHASGRAAVVCDTNIDIEKATDIIVSSALEWPIGCAALKAVFDSNSKHEDLLNMVKEKFDRVSKYIDDPMKSSTKIGYIDPTIISHVFQRARTLEKLGQAEIIHGETYSDIQASPLLTVTKDKNSEFLSTEFSLYITSIKKCESYDQAIKEVNETGTRNKRLVISILSHHPADVLKKNLNAHHIKVFRKTTEVDLLFHEGNDYVRKLTLPQIHRGF